MTVPARDAIEAMLHPRAIAVIGATERMQYGGRLVANLMRTGYSGQIIPVNPRREQVFGLPCAPTISDAPGYIDLAAIVIPADAVPGAIEECDRRGVGSVLVITAGFAETMSGAGQARQERLLKAATRVRICGPNCLGVASVPESLWATANVLAPVDERVRPGGISIVS